MKSVALFYLKYVLSIYLIKTKHFTTEFCALAYGNSTSIQYFLLTLIFLVDFYL